MPQWSCPPGRQHLDPVRLGQVGRCPCRNVGFVPRVFLSPEAMPQDDHGPSSLAVWQGQLVRSLAGTMETGNGGWPSLWRWSRGRGTARWKGPWWLGSREVHKASLSPRLGTGKTGSRRAGSTVWARPLPLSTEAGAQGHTNYRQRN